MRPALVALLACIAAAAFPAGAVAIRCAPPGNSGIDQYFETIPGASCNQAPPGSPGAGSSGGAHLSPGQSRRLAALGPAGRAVAQFVAATAPAIEGTSPSGTAPARGQKASPVLIAAAPPTASGEPPVIGLLKPIVSGSAPGGVGIVLPIVLAALLLLAVVTGLRRLLIRR